VPQVGRFWAIVQHFSPFACISETVADICNVEVKSAVRGAVERAEQSGLFFVARLFPEMLPELTPDAIQHWLAQHFPHVFAVRVAVQHGPHSRVLLVLDTDEGIGIDELTGINRRFRKEFEAAAALPEHFEVEVTSPGLTEPLVLPRQFQRHMGRTVEAVLPGPDGTPDRTVRGTLTAATADAFTVQYNPNPRKKANPELRTETFPYAATKRVTLVLQFALAED
jgi:ribosome maturation factor RimP